jgi:hypothetical protein
VRRVFVGDQLRRCDLGRADTAPGYAALVAAYARDHPDEEWITGGGWSMDALVTQTWIRGQVVYQQH